MTFHFIYRTAGIICPSICCNFGAWFCSVSVITHNNESNEGESDGNMALIKLVFVAYGFVQLTRPVIGDGPQFNPGNCSQCCIHKLEIVDINYEKGWIRRHMWSCPFVITHVVSDSELWIHFGSSRLRSDCLRVRVSFLIYTFKEYSYKM